MKNKLVIMQPHFIPWYGYFDLIRFSDNFIFLDDVQYIKRSFINRIKFDYNNKIGWLTFPTEYNKTKTNINSTKLFEKEKNILKFQKKIEHSLKKEKNFNLVRDVLNSIKLDDIETISDLNIYFIKSLSKIIFKEEKNFSLSSKLNIKNKKSDRILDICNHFGSKYYVTGMGGLNYLNREKFKLNNIKIIYLNYSFENLNFRDKKDHISILNLLAKYGENINKKFTTTQVDLK